MKKKASERIHKVTGPGYIKEREVEGRGQLLALLLYLSAFYYFIYYNKQKSIAFEI